MQISGSVAWENFVDRECFCKDQISHSLCNSEFGYTKKGILPIYIFCGAR